MSEELLDWKEAMTRVLDKRDLYVKLLGKFIETERDTPDKVGVALKNGNAEEARQLVHNTKGVAANLGAKALASAALELEMAIKAGGRHKPRPQPFQHHRYGNPRDHARLHDPVVPA